MNDGIIAFHELVAVKSWADSSTRGPSMKVLLGTRDSLALFDTVTKRAGKRAGQRYKSVWQDSAITWSLPVDLWFAGANWAHQDGASVKFSLTSTDLESFRNVIDFNPEGELPKYWLTLVQIDDDEKPIDQIKAADMEALKGGPKSKRIAMLCQQRDFQAYVTYRTNIKCETMEAADAWVKGQCGVASKREFDHNADAWSMFEARVMSPFIRWGEGSRWSDEEEAT